MDDPDRPTVLYSLRSEKKLSAKRRRMVEENWLGSGLPLHKRDHLRTGYSLWSRGTGGGG